MALSAREDAIGRLLREQGITRGSVDRVCDELVKAPASLRSPTVFTKRCEASFDMAGQEAERSESHVVEPVHLALGLLGTPGSVAAAVMRSLRVDELILLRRAREILRGS